MFSRFSQTSLSHEDGTSILQLFYREVRHTLLDQLTALSLGNDMFDGSVDSSRRGGSFQSLLPLTLALTSLLLNNTTHPPFIRSAELSLPLFLLQSRQFRVLKVSLTFYVEHR